MPCHFNSFDKQNIEQTPMHDVPRGETGAGMHSAFVGATGIVTACLHKNRKTRRQKCKHLKSLTTEASRFNVQNMQTYIVYTCWHSLHTMEFIVAFIEVVGARC